MLAKREAGPGSLLISEDRDELMTMSDRIAVLNGGELAVIRDAGTTNPTELGYLTVGAVA